MEPIDIVILSLLAVAVSGIILYLIKQKKKGKSGCGCGCNGCPSAGSCGKASQKATENEDV